LTRKDYPLINKIIQASLVCLVFSWSLIPGNLSARLVDRVLAIVNDEIVTLSELEERKQKLISEITRMVNPRELEKRIDEVEAQTLQMMLEEILILQKAEEAGMKISEGAINNAIGNVIHSNNLGGLEELETALRGQGLSLHEYKEVVRKQMLIYRFQNSELKSQIRIIDDEVKAAYEQNLDILKTPITFHIQHILFQISPETSKDNTLDEAQIVYKKLDSGFDFCQAAKDYSDDPTGESCGDLGILTTQEMLPEFIEAVEKLSDDSSYTKPFLTKYGYHIVNIVEKTGGEPLPFDKVEAEIREQLYQEKFIKKRGEWLEELKKTNYIKIIGEKDEKN